MAVQPHPAVVDAYWQAVRDRDASGIADLVTEDFIEDWPQSGERIRGAAAWAQVVNGHPTYPSVSVRRILGSGDVFVCEAEFDYGGESAAWHICSIMELSGERIRRIVQYFGAPFPTPEWRREITEPIGP